MNKAYIEAVVEKNAEAIFADLPSAFTKLVEQYCSEYTDYEQLIIKISALLLTETTKASTLILERTLIELLGNDG
ncbi:MAG: hypothetical protein FWG63_03020 [Defluviitaleaceae bacterium]|nr:hypothetical protein [Defluviitaleaceae bacterium]